MEINNRTGYPLVNGNMVLKGYDTEKDLEKAKKDIERAFVLLSGHTIYEIMKFLAPYRLKSVKNCQQEYDELTEKAKNERKKQEEN